VSRVAVEEAVAVRSVEGVDIVFLPSVGRRSSTGMIRRHSAAIPGKRDFALPVAAPG